VLFRRALANGEEMRAVNAELNTVNATLEQRVAERTAAAEERAKELARSNAELEQFSSIASHDLQEPLRKIRMFGDRLRERLGEGLAEEPAADLERIESAATRMQRLINDLLACRRQRNRVRREARRAGLCRFRASPRSFGLRRHGNRPLDRAQDRLALRRSYHRLRGPEPGCDLHGHAPASPVSFYERPQRRTHPMKPALPVTILVVDDDDRQMTIEALRKSRLSNDVRIAVDGEELMDYLLRRGQYSDPADAPVPGHGTTFRIYLPPVEVPADRAAPGPEDDEAEPARGTETILLVDDEELVRAFGREVLADSGYNVIEADDGAHALELARGYEGDIHLLVTDVVMPDLSGRELADQLAKERPGIQTLYTSGYASDSIVRHGVLEPGIAFLPKPMSRTSLTRKVRELLD
jgi:CheY-like chemotaxis protein